MGYAFLATSGHRLETSKIKCSSGRMTGAKHVPLIRGVLKLR